ncbi:hypothetical protein NH340_JMT01292 [Sarcoptes scabiei]|nr:hypothetical protein NH340_JMT01292 [Sarcoptes scabiei]
MSLRNLARLKLINANFLNLANAQIKYMPIRSCGWVQDYKPGPYPKTAAEREAAAKKYNLIPEDYEPYEEGSGYGDYPKLPIVGEDDMDPYENFDFYYYRRNYGQTLHIDYDVYCSEKSDPNASVTAVPLSMIILYLIAPFAFVILIHVIDVVFDLHSANPTKPKHYYGDGKVHYSFEPLD